MKNETVEVEIRFKATVKKEGLDELKRVVNNHLNGLCDFEDWPEITDCYGASLSIIKD